MKVASYSDLGGLGTKQGPPVGFVWTLPNFLPLLLPSLLTGFALSFARAVGEYGSIIFIAGNMPMVSEITPLLIITKLEQYDYKGATALALVMLLVSFGLLFVINQLQRWSRRRGKKPRD